MQIISRNASRIGVDDRCRGPLVFAWDRCNLAGKRAIDARCNSLDQLPDSALVFRIVEGPEKRHSERLDPFLVNQKPYGRSGFCFVELLQNGALIIGPLGYPDNAIGIDQRWRTLGLYRMLDSILRQATPAAVGAPRSEKGILEAASCDEAGAGAIASENCVVDYR